jgi:hypothetical protein
MKNHEYTVEEIREALLSKPESFDALEAELERRRKVRDRKREDIHPSNYLSGTAAP